jgi:hypothetical protein
MPGRRGHRAVAPPRRAASVQHGDHARRGRACGKLSDPGGTIGGCWTPPPPSRWACSPNRSSSSYARRASWRRTRTARGGTGSATSTGRPRPRGRRGPTTRWAPACTPALRSWFDLPPAKRRPEAVGTLLRATWVATATGTSAGTRRRTSGRWRGCAATWTSWSPASNRWRSSARSAPRPPPWPCPGGSTGSTRASGRGVTRSSVIVDYKTGRTGLGPDDARGSRALALYAYAAERLFRRRTRRVELHHLPTGTVAAHEHTEESLGPARPAGRADRGRRDGGRAGGARRRRPGRELPGRAGARSAAGVTSAGPARPGRSGRTRAVGRPRPGTGAGRGGLTGTRLGPLRGCGGWAVAGGSRQT